LYAFLDNKKSHFIIKCDCSRLSVYKRKLSSQANEITELKKFSTAQTLQSLQDSQDKEGLQKVITNQTMQILELQKSINDMKVAN